MTSRDEKREGEPPFRFVHCSDVHLDAPCACPDAEVRALLAEDARATLRRLVDLCLAEKVHALVVAGDLFDDERLTLATEEFLAAELARLAGAGVTVVIAGGNHDNARPDGRLSSLALPEGVLVAGAAPLQAEVRDGAGRVVGRIAAVGHARPGETQRLVESLPPAGDGPPSVAVLHGFVEGARGCERHEPLAPCGPDDFAALGHRYFALGHVHERQQVGRKPAAHYPGSLVAQGFAEPGPRGALLVALGAKGEPKVEFRPLAGARFELLAPAGLEQAGDLRAVRAACVQAFEALRAGDPRPEARWLLRFTLSGPCACAAECQRDELLEELGEDLTALLRPFGVLHAQVLDEGVTRPLDIQPHAGRPHVLGEALALAAALDDDALLERVVPAALAGAPLTDQRAYVRSLLKDIDRAAAEALLREVRP
jgi:hypothetical protein